MRTLGRTLAVTGAVLVASTGLSACGKEGPTSLNIAAIDVQPDDVVKAVFTGGKKTAEIEQLQGIWVAQKGATAEGAVLLEGGEDRVFPVNAYRIIEGYDQNNPLYGLTKGSGRSMEITDSSGKVWRLTVGNQTFNLAGFYAKVDGDPKIYLITALQVADIISFATGSQFAFPLTAKYREVDRRLEGAAGEGLKDDTPDYHPWLKQVMARNDKELEKVASEIVAAPGSGGNKEGPATRVGPSASLGGGLSE